MAITYKKLFHLLIDREMTPAELQKEAGYSANISTRLRRDHYVSLESMEKICRVLNCKVDDIIEFIQDKEDENDGYFIAGETSAHVGISRNHP